MKKCDQPIAHQQIHNFCGKPKKLTKQFSLNQAHLFDQITSRSRNVNQNFTAEISDEYSEKNSMDICGINAAKDDFTRYLSEKKLQHLGTRNLHKSNSMKNLHTFLHFNQFVGDCFDDQSAVCFYSYRWKISERISWERVLDDNGGVDIHRSIIDRFSREKNFEEFLNILNDVLSYAHFICLFSMFKKNVY